MSSDRVLVGQDLLNLEQRRWHLVLVPAGHCSMIRQKVVPIFTSESSLQSSVTVEAECCRGILVS